MLLVHASVHPGRDGFKLHYYYWYYDCALRLARPGPFGDGPGLRVTGTVTASGRLSESASVNFKLKPPQQANLKAGP
jgi:hypothetical protein